jgi:hypothetical protein
MRLNAMLHRCPARLSWAAGIGLVTLVAYAYRQDRPGRNTVEEVRTLLHDGALPGENLRDGVCFMTCTSFT